jgi:dipeptidase E
MFLSSYVIADNNSAIFEKLIGKPRDEIKMAWIQNAKDTYEDTTWVDKVSEILARNAGQIDVIDLRKYNDEPAKIEEDLSGYDVIWVGGGNSFYLRWIMRESGFDKAVRTLMEKGVVYAGDSAGAIVAGPTLDGFQGWDHENDAPELVLDGLNLVDLIIVPHLDNKKYGDIPKQRLALFNEKKANVIGLNDTDAIVVNNDRITKISDGKEIQL